MSKAPQPLRAEDRLNVSQIIRIKLEHVARVERVAQGLEVGLKWGDDDTASDQWDEQAQKPFADELAARPVTQREPGSRPRQEKKQRHSPLGKEVEQVHPTRGPPSDWRC